MTEQQLTTKVKKYKKNHPHTTITHILHHFQTKASLSDQNYFYFLFEYKIIFSQGQ